MTPTSSTTGFTVSSTDLLDGLPPTAISGTSDQESLGSDTTGVALTNGAFGPPGLVASPNSQMTIANNGASVTYTLTGSATGYDITGVDTYSAWRDSGRVNQDYTLYYATVDAPTAFVALQAVSQAYSGGSPSDLMVSITGLTATGVGALRFDFPATQNGYVGYRELDAFGSPTAATPEPASLSVIALTGLALGRRRR